VPDFVLECYEHEEVLSYFFALQFQNRSVALSNSGSKTSATSGSVGKGRIQRDLFNSKAGKIE